MNRPGEDTLIRYFRGECLPDEADAVRLYLAMNIDDAYVNACLREAWGDADALPAAAIPAAQLNERWQALETLRTTDAQPVRKLRRLMPVMRYAAAIILLLTGLFLFRTLRHTPATTIAAISWQSYRAPFGKTRQLSLSDGSVVTLFPGSEIQLPANYNQQERTVLLKGRAFFEIAPQAQHPFYVKTPQLTTQVLGTAFEVHADGQSTTSSITLLNGRVRVSHATQPLATLDPGQQVVFDSLTRQWRIHLVNAKEIMAWTTGEFIYEHATLQQVFSDMEKWYDVTIAMKGKMIAGQVITTNFKGLQLDQVLSILSKASGFRYRINGKQVTVSAMP